MVDARLKTHYGLDEEGRALDEVEGWYQVDGEPAGRGGLPGAGGGSPGAWAGRMGGRHHVDMYM